MPDPMANQFVMGNDQGVSNTPLRNVHHTDIWKLDFDNFQFANNGTTDVLQDFDFDSFLHQDGEGVNEFNFDAASFLDTEQIGTE